MRTSAVFLLAKSAKRLAPTLFNRSYPEGLYAVSLWQDGAAMQNMTCCILRRLLFLLVHHRILIIIDRHRRMGLYSRPHITVSTVEMMWRAICHFYRFILEAAATQPQRHNLVCRWLGLAPSSHRLLLSSLSTSSSSSSSQGESNNIKWLGTHRHTCHILKVRERKREKMAWSGLALGSIDITVFYIVLLGRGCQRAHGQSLPFLPLDSFYYTAYSSNPLGWIC
jgi:hypothetical protein